MRAIRTLAASASLAAIALGAAPALAEEQPQTPQAEEQAADDLFGGIVVTARKREESLQDVPVAVTAFGEKFIETFKINSIQNVAAFTPGLIQGDANTGAAGRIFLRGIGSSTDSGLIDGAVSINVDGVQAGGQIMRAATFDLGQIEVLRGPQALFFGKNSPGGVISLKSARPTDRLEIGGNIGYEFVGDEAYVEGHVSGPLSDGVRARVAARYSHTEGYWKIVSAAVPGASLGASNDRAPKQEEFVVRGVLEGDLGETVDFSTTHTFTHLNVDNGVILQRIHCATGTAITIPGFESIEDCKINNTVVTGDLFPAQLAADPSTRNKATGYIENRQYLGTLTVNWQAAPDLKLTSVTGYYDAFDASSQNFSITPVPFIFATPLLDLRQFTQEIRLASSFAGPVNFVAGGYYENGRADNTLAIPAVVLPNGSAFSETVIQNRRVLSAFGQLSFKPVESFEIAAGGRYSSERKIGDYYSTAIPGATARQKATFNNFSPEVTVQFKPSSQLNVYASYKTGFKSGGLDAGSQIPTGFIASSLGGAPIDVVYDQEKAKGFEGGVKYTSPDNRFRGGLAVFAYKYTGLQLTKFDPSKLSITVANAAGAKTAGVEADFNWRPMDGGLTLYGTVAYLDSKYTDFDADCYGGQSFQQGCNIDLNNDGIGDRQSLAGAQLKNAPRWAATLGFNYETPVGGLKFGLSGDGNYTGSYNPSSENAPAVRQEEFVKLNASVRIGAEDDRWQLALIGQNLTNRYVVIEASKEFISGGAALQGTAQSYPVDYFGNVLRGREVRVQASFKF